MRVIAALACGSVFMLACMPSPRFGRTESNTPRSMATIEKGRQTNDYLRFGLIISTYLGKPYKGKSQYQTGIDCSLFTQEVFREYAKITLGRTVDDQFRDGKEVLRNRLMPCDLVFFTTERDRVSHVGVYVGHNQFAHASSTEGVILSNMNDLYWAKRYVGARRVTGPNQDR